MIRKHFTKTTKLSRNELREVKNLATMSQNIDGFKTRFYWNIMEDRKLPEFDDFLLYIENNLAAYIGIFAFKEEEAELSVLINPKYRRQGYFKVLLTEAIFELHRRHFRKCLLICNRKATMASQIVQKLNAIHSHSEFEMTFKNSFAFNELPQIELREYQQEDIIELAQMDAICFDGLLEKMLFRFINTAKEKNRKIYIALYNNEKIGKVHLRFDDKNHAYIHDLCVLPAHQRKHFATAMVLKITALLIQKKMKAIYLDVESENVSAIKLYEKCGYEITNIQDFWRYDISKGNSSNSSP